MIEWSSIIHLEMWKSDSFSFFLNSHLNSSILTSNLPVLPLFKWECQTSGIKAETKVTCLHSRLHPRDATERFDLWVSGLRWRPSQPSLVEPWTVSGHVSSLLSSHYLNVNKSSLPWFHSTGTTQTKFVVSTKGEIITFWPKIPALNSCRFSVK